ncbi:MAG: tyrosine-type recombinase/integrase [Lachnospiraceae bacterium]
MDNQIYNIINDMSEVLNVAQMKKLQEVLIERLVTQQAKTEENDNNAYLDMFLTAKRIEGCSERTLEYYRSTIKTMLDKIKIPVRQMTTEMLRDYLSQYQRVNNCGKVTIDNIRRNLSSFFSWLEEEDHILKSPIRRIHKIKTKKVVKETISDENMEVLRDGCCEIRDLAMIDILASTGIRVGELVNLDIADLNFEERECIVYGKGDKERKVYFDARTKLHIQKYLETRNDDNPALFVSLKSPYERLQISGVEIRLRELGRQLGICNIHPHKFRRTMATRAIDKGMPIEQVQKLLGHQQIDTTMQYAMVNQSNVKSSHRKYIA